MAFSVIARVTLVTLATVPPDAVARREHIAISRDVAAALGLPIPLSGRMFQVRVAVTAPAGAAGSNATFTVVAILPGRNQVALFPRSSPGAADGGIFKLFGGGTLPPGAQATLFSQAPSVTTLDGAPFGASFAEPCPGRYFRESAVTGSGGLLLLAPHGGHLEEETGTQLALLRRELAALGHTPAAWEAQGVWGGGETMRRWHVAATDVNPASFPGLGHLVRRYSTFPSAVSLHGFSWDGERAADPDTWKYGIVIGGRAGAAEKEAVRDAIVAETGPGRISFAIADMAGDVDLPQGPHGSLAKLSRYTRLRGMEKADLVNRLAPGGGIHLEQSRGVREAYAAEVARGLARALGEILDSYSAVDIEPELCAAG